MEDSDKRERRYGIFQNSVSTVQNLNKISSHPSFQRIFKEGGLREVLTYRCCPLFLVFFVAFFGVSSIIRPPLHPPIESIESKHRRQKVTRVVPSIFKKSRICFSQNRAFFCWLLWFDGGCRGGSGRKWKSQNRNFEAAQMWKNRGQHRYDEKRCSFLIKVRRMFLNYSRNTQFHINRIDHWLFN